MRVRASPPQTQHHLTLPLTLLNRNKLFDTKFYYYKSADASKPAAVRAESYTLEDTIADHVDAVLFTTQLPVSIAPRGHRADESNGYSATPTNTITPG